MLRILSLFLALCAASLAQSTGTIQATGTATLNVQPDQVQLTVTVITQATTAAQAGQQNATQTSAMISALNQVLGKSGMLQTTGYSIYPRYSNTANQPSTIIGYTAENTLQATAYDLTLAGPLIDAANQAGASSVGSLNYGLQNSEPSRQQALTQAGKTALAHASAIAAGLNGKAGSVLSAVEGVVSSVYPVAGGAAGTGSATPVLTGTVTVTATVTITVQLQ